MPRAKRQSVETSEERPALAPIELNGEVVERWCGWPRYSIGGEDLVYLLSDLAGQRVRVVIEVEDGARGIGEWPGLGT